VLKVFSILELLTNAQRIFSAQTVQVHCQRM